uniref:Uncharacterized protein n=1 Tax=Glossina brevipalpis TaxID=37001 RepID=A0A1A9WPU0_9MUSC
MEYLKSLNASFANFHACELNQYTSKLCESGAKFYRFFIEKSFSSLKTFDLLLLYSFVMTIIAFSVTIIFLVFDPFHSLHVSRRIRNTASKFRIGGGKFATKSTFKNSKHSPNIISLDNELPSKHLPIKISTEWISMEADQNSNSSSKLSVNKSTTKKT